jgi:hypothetical protein
MSEFEKIADKIMADLKEQDAATPGMVGPVTSMGNPSVAYLPGGFLKKRKGKAVIKPELPEARSEDVHGLYDRLTHVLTIDLRENRQVKRTLVLMNYWLTVFKNSKFLPMSGQVVIQLNTYDKSIRDLVNRIQNIHTDDIGNLEMMIDTIQDDRPLNAYEPFAEYDYLVGCRVQSEHNGVVLILELTVNMAMVPTQSIYIESQEVLDEIEGYKTVKVLKDMVFPVGEMFRPAIFNNIRDIIDETME